MGRKWIWAIAIVLAAGLAGYYINLNAARWLSRPAASLPALGPSPKPGVLAGQRLPWRTLYHQRMTLLDSGGVIGGLVAGDFDKDPDQELLWAGNKRGLVFEA